MKHSLPALAALLALSACNSQPDVDVKNAKPGEVADPVQAAGGADSFVSPGKWQTSFKLEEMSMPGMPQQVADQMKARMNVTDTSESCLTAEDVKKPREDFFAGANRHCTYDHFTMSGGKIDAAMTCKDGGATMAMTIKGTYSADHYTARSTMTSSGAGPAGGMTMKSTIDAKRVGDCS